VSRQHHPRAALQPRSQGHRHPARRRRESSAAPTLVAEPAVRNGVAVVRRWSSDRRLTGGGLEKTEPGVASVAAATATGADPSVGSNGRRPVAQPPTWADRPADGQRAGEPDDASVHASCPMRFVPWRRPMGSGNGHAWASSDGVTSHREDPVRRANEAAYLATGAPSPSLADPTGALNGQGGAEVSCGGCTACCSSSQFIHIGPDKGDEGRDRRSSRRVGRWRREGGGPTSDHTGSRLPHGNPPCSTRATSPPGRRGSREPSSDPPCVTMIRYIRSDRAGLGRSAWRR
jgi:hypothetical protein